MRPLSLVVILMALVSIMFGVPTDGMAEDSIVSCTFTRQVLFDVFPGRVKAPQVSDEQFTVIFSGLDSLAPTMKRDTRESRLKTLRRKERAIWMAEAPPSGGVTIWTVFLDEKAAIVSKQYQLLGQGFGLMATGTCK